jgi:hypothetical protein
MILPNLWDKTPEAPSPSELNPLTNPLLEQHLGRWAKVYFGTPPAKREQAVNSLLEEIKRESGASAPIQSGRPYFATDPNFATDPKFRRTVCATCQHQNPPGHKFCSRCGQVLSPEQPSSSANLGAPEIADALPTNSAHDAPWLHDQAFSGLEGSGASQGRGWKYLAGAAVIVLAGLAYLHWAPEFRTRVASTKPPPVSAPAATLPPGDSSSADGKAAAEEVAPESIVSGSQTESKTDSKKREANNPPVTGGAGDRAVVPPGVQAATQRSTLPSAAAGHSTASGLESSSPDLRLAQRYLGGSTGARDPSEAAKLLWRAVAKQNATAAVLLSDLYARGDGVPRSCDQARLLLAAAAKRGSPLAAQQLRNLESQGCQ